MAKKKSKKTNVSSKKQSSATIIDDGENAVSNITTNTADTNESDLFDTTDKTMRKRKEHLNDFYHKQKRTKGLFYGYENNQLWLMAIYA